MMMMWVKTSKVEKRQMVTAEEINWIKSSFIIKNMFNVPVRLHSVAAVFIN